LQEGFNVVSFDLDTSTPGDHQYEIVVSTDDDSNALNNKYYFNQSVAEKLKVLFLGSSSEDMEAARNLYPDSDIDYYVNDYAIPFTVEELCQYDEFVLSNVDIRNYNNHTQFVNSLDILVSEFGKSLVTIGNTYIQNNEDSEVLSSLSDMLPVKFGNEDKKKTVTILLDVSRSMEQISRLIIAKKAACEILDKLDDDVKVSCITFYGEVKPLFILKDASERDSLKEMINKAEAYQGTFLGAALGYTYSTVLAQSNTKNEVVLISDGLPYKEQANVSLHYANMMAEQGIVLSTIQTATEDIDAQNLMKELATIGKGYYSYIHEVDDVKDTIYNEVFNSLNETVLENQELPVSILLEKDELVNGIESLSNIKGIYNNTAKASSKVILDALYTDVDSTQYRIPLYASWEYGNGHVSSFASTISGEWISLWNDSQERSVLTSIIPVNSPSERLDSAFIMELNTEGTNGSIVVKAPTLNKDSVLTVKVTYPNGLTEEKILASIIDANVQKYMTEIKTDQVGEYNVMLSYSLGELLYSASYQFDISYLPEYDSFTIYEASNLYYMVSSNGQVSEDGHLTLENNYSNVEKYVVDFTPALMILTIVFFVVDIMIRKLRLQDIVSLFKKITKNVEGAGK
ncbi:MAG: VWA domain-containing protein, partial [Bacilli bacterium]